MSIFAFDETICEREGNRCKRRNKCKRYINHSATSTLWVADYFKEFQQSCEYFVLIKEKPFVKSSPENKNDKGQEVS